MTARTKKLSAFLAILATPWGLATMGLAGRAGRPLQGKTAGTAQEIDGAYRDGLFWGELDGQHGRKAHPSIARWNDEKDRAAFKLGYEKGYRAALNSTTALGRH